MPAVPRSAQSPGAPGGAPPDEPTLTHLDASGRARMVDVTAKPFTHRRAMARARVALPAGALDALGTAAAPGAPCGNSLPAEATLEAARVAGIQAAKATARLIPLCHPLAISEVDVRCTLGERCVEIEATCEVVGPTGIEMEALSACALAALSVIAAAGPADQAVRVETLDLFEKSGGRSGTWVRS